MEACYEYLGCREKDCPMYGQKGNKHCWEVEGTLCNHIGIQLVSEDSTGTKEDACANLHCIYYEAARDRGI